MPNRNTIRSPFADLIGVLDSEWFSTAEEATPMTFSLLRRGKAAAAIAIGAGAIAMAGSLPASAAPAAPRANEAPGSASWAGPVVLVNCQHHGVVTPRSFVLSCADHDDFLTNMHWVSWRAVAYGSGVEHTNNCIPNCASGHFHRFPVLITVWRPKLRDRHDHFKFTRITLIYPRNRPLRFNAHGKKHHPLTFTFHV